VTITIHRDMVQGSEEWHAARCGLLTASEMKLIITPTLKVADNDKSRAHLYELLAQRITRYVEPSYISDDMLRGMEDEILARQVYAEKFAEIEEVGFVTNDEWGFTLGCSPDALVGDDGLLEIKSRRQKFQVATLIDGEMPDDYAIQVQTELLVTGRAWADFISYSGGLPMIPIRVFSDDKIQSAIVDAARAFEMRLSEKLIAYDRAIETNTRLVPTERRIEQEMHL
jgi:predicted phage-related endonuclease